MGEYLTLRKGCYLVRGPKRGAIYDLNKGVIYSLDPLMLGPLLLCLEGVPFDRAFYGARGFEKHFNIMENHVKALPFVSLEDRSQGPDSISAVILKGGKEPGAAWLELTNRCNMRCIHCYAESGPALDQELTLDEWRGVVDQLFSLGFKQFCICGGEPFVFAGLMPLLRHLVDKRAESILVFTNATLMTDDVAGFFAEQGIGVNITFYSHLQEHHEKISRMKGSWDLTLQGIRRVIKVQAPYSINIPLGAYNQNDLEQTIDFLESVGVEKGLAGGNIVYPMGRGCDCSVLPDRQTIFSVKSQTYQLPMTCGGRLIYETCWSGKLLIKANGDVTPCPSAREEEFVVGNSRKDPLEKILSRERLHRLWEITLDNVAVCSDCEFRYGCHDCRANSFVYLRDLYARNPYCLYDPIKGAWIQTMGDRDRAETDSVWVRTKGFSTWRDNGEMILLHKETGAIHMLNPVGATIYGFLDQARSMGDLVNHLMARYQVEEGRVRKDLASMLYQLKELGIVSCSG